MKILNESAVNLEMLKHMIHEDLVEASEPVIQEAVREAEKKIRERMAVFLMGQIDSQVDMERFGNTVRISFNSDRSGA